MQSIYQSRLDTRNYHEEFYKQTEVFQPGTWVEQPEPSVPRLTARLATKTTPWVLDIGSGIGRNAIPIAKAIKQSGGTVICVDELEVAQEKLVEYAKQYAVNDVIETICSEIEHFVIDRDTYDLILAIGVLEHCSSKQSFASVLSSIKKGTKSGGTNRLLIHTDRQVRDLNTKELLPSVIDCDLSLEETCQQLVDLYQDWHIEEISSSYYEEELVLNERDVHWSAHIINVTAHNDQC